MTTEEIRAQHPDPDAFDAWLAEYEIALRSRIAKSVNSRRYVPVGGDIWETAKVERRAAVRIVLGQ